MPVEKDSSFTHAIDSALFIRFSRIAIVAASVVGLPLAGWALTRVISRADYIADTTERTAVQLRLLDENVRLTFEQRARDMDRLESALRDHEQRLRPLERASNGELGTRPTGRP